MSRVADLLMEQIRQRVTSGDVEEAAIDEIERLEEEVKKWRALAEANAKGWESCLKHWTPLDVELKFAEKAHKEKDDG